MKKGYNFFQGEAYPETNQEATVAAQTGDDADLKSCGGKEWRYNMDLRGVLEIKPAGFNDGIQGVL